MIARERPLCDCPDWWHEFRLKRSRKATLMVSQGWTRDLNSCQACRNRRATAQTQSPAWNCSAAMILQA